MRYAHMYSTELGEISIEATDKAVCALYFGKCAAQTEENTVLKQAAIQLEEYLRGIRKQFDLRLELAGTPFQKAVWNALLKIPYGQTRTYSQIAETVGNKKACRAVGMANHRNPIGIIIPCHRVIGADGTLTGYAGGVEHKRQLLELEKNHIRYFSYGEKELSYLRQKDKRLAALIRHIDKPSYEVIPDLYAALAYNIIGQQISMSAMQTVWQRMLSRYGSSITPDKIICSTAEEIQALGMSHKKAAAIRQIAEKIHSGEFAIENIRDMTDEDVREYLTSLNGVGPWTAEMVMIFSLERKNILSWGDLGIRQGICTLYGLKQLTREQFERYRKRYSPYGTIAGFYLWNINARTDEEVQKILRDI